MSKPELRIDVFQEEGAVRLALAGELDLGSAPMLMAELHQARAAHRSVVLDLSQLDFIDSTGVHVLIDAARSADRDGWEFTLSPELSPQVAYVLDLTGVQQRLRGGGG
jgi:anti-anti-sigma factor